MRQGRPDPAEHGQSPTELNGMLPTPEIYYLNVAPKKHTGEGLALVAALILLFVLLIAFVGHPKPPPHSRDVTPAHASSSQPRR